MANNKVMALEEDKSVIDFKFNFKTYWKFLSKHKWVFFLLLFLILVAEALTTVDKFLFKWLIDQGTLYIGGTLTQQVFVGVLMAIVVIFLGALFSRSVLKWINLHLINIIEVDLIREMKRYFFAHLIHLSHNFHTTHRTGSLISRLNRGGGAIEKMTDLIVFNFAPLLFEVVVVGASLLYFSWVPALIVLIMVIIFIAYSFFVQTIQRRANINALAAEDEEKGMISDVFTNVDSIKYFGKELWIMQNFAKVTYKTLTTRLKHWSYFRWLDAGQNLIFGIGTFFLIYFPAKQFLAGTLSLGTLVFIYSVYGGLGASLFGFVWGIRRFYEAMADFQALFQYAKMENEIKDKPNAKDISVSNGEIEFKDVNFSYHHKKILSDFNLKVGKNQKVAIVGTSGSGKSTIIKLLYRLYDLQGGQILIDGKDIRDVRQESIRSELSIVPQECVLFNDTIYNNIAFSKPNASDAEILKAIKFAQLDKFIKDLPNREQTIVGERGVKLSGGEKQRVSIARAILADKKVLVLDEATSSLDSQTEHEIQKDLKGLLKGKTSLIIAHRLSTIMGADKIVVIDKGKVVQEGKHSKLIEQPGTYRKLWNLQKGGYI